MRDSPPLKMGLLQAQSYERGRPAFWARWRYYAPSFNLQAFGALKQPSRNSSSTKFSLHYLPVVFQFVWYATC